MACTCSVKFAMRLKLGDTNFQLRAVVTHCGENFSGGHYFATVRHGDNWFKCNDGEVVSLDPGSVASHMQRNAYGGWDPAVAGAPPMASPFTATLLLYEQTPRGT